MTQPFRYLPQLTVASGRICPCGCCREMVPVASGLYFCPAAFDAWNAAAEAKALCDSDLRKPEPQVTP